MSLLFRHLAESFRKPDHWLYASWLDVITKYRKNALGLFWIFFPPIVYIWGLGAFMGAIQGRQMGSFLAHIGFGFMLFRLMSTMFIEAGATFAAHLPYIHDGNLRLTDYVLRTLSKALIHFLFAVPLLALVLVGEASVSPLGLLSSLAGLLIVLVNLFFLGVLVALVGARYPDVNDFFGSVMLAVFLITPIVWLAEAAPADSMQGMLMRANPFHHMLAVVRGPILGEASETSTYVYIGAMTIAGVLISAFSYSRFARRVPIWL
ncbi:ABC-type polysaccharide/polyol phosphate export permease [Pseudoxanthomonas japonensis]|uniref:ABC transporter permease n=1 Tax=Pseudoxanthomonas japonensis TaxID=69284 RepID=UPI001A48D9E9|nr:hypothetical protein [Pseudoxanthomonas japonensis]MBL8256914.1 ABC transporter permease [Pseudoxanthomonas mexicana]MDR7069432.1 ABC-type polysaccharide/polyol phosphate export permease [Pseudoxanthomonas japonensis]